MIGGHASEVTALAFAASGKLAFAAARDGSVRLLDPAGGATLHTLQHASSVARMALSQDEHALWTACEDGTLWKWSLDWGLAEAPMPSGGDTVSKLAGVRPSTARPQPPARGSGAWRQPADTGESPPRGVHYLAAIALFLASYAGLVLLVPSTPKATHEAPKPDVTKDLARLDTQYPQVAALKEQRYRGRQQQQTRSPIEATSLRVIWFDRQTTWMSLGGKAPLQLDSVLNLIRKRDGLGQPEVTGARPVSLEAALRDLTDGPFARTGLDCILASPASLSYRSQLRTSGLLAPRAGRVRLSTASELAALGYANRYARGKTEGPAVKMFLDVCGEHVSGTLAEIAEGVVEVQGSVGALSTSPGSRERALADTVRRVVDRLAVLAGRRRAQCGEILVSGAAPTLLQELKAGPPIAAPVTPTDDLVATGLVVQSAMLLGSADAKDVLLLAATAEYRVGVFLSVASNAGPRGTFIELLPEFTTIPTRKSVEVETSAGPTHVSVAESVGADVTELMKVPWSVTPGPSSAGGRLVVSIEVDADKQMVLPSRTQPGARRRNTRSPTPAASAIPIRASAHPRVMSWMISDPVEVTSFSVKSSAGSRAAVLPSPPTRRLRLPRVLPPPRACCARSLRPQSLVATGPAGRRGAHRHGGPDQEPARCETKVATC